VIECWKLSRNCRNISVADFMQPLKLSCAVDMYNRCTTKLRSCDSQESDWFYLWRRVFGCLMRCCVFAADVDVSPSTEYMVMLTRTDMIVIVSAVLVAIVALVIILLLRWQWVRTCWLSRVQSHKMSIVVCRAGRIALWIPFAMNNFYFYRQQSRR